MGGVSAVESHRSRSLWTLGDMAWRPVQALVGDDREALCVSPVSVAFFHRVSQAATDGEVHVSGQAARRRVLLATASARGQVKVMASAVACHLY